MIAEVMAQTENKMQHGIEATRRDLASIRTGRANPAILDKIQVEAYGSQMPINQLATVAAPEPRLLVISPWDKTVIGAIRNAIAKSDLGLNPQSDGNVLRLPLPSLTEERRRELARVVSKKTEEAKVAIRNVRRDAIEELRRMEKAGDISEDELKRAQDQVQKLTDKYVQEVDRLHDSKVAEITEV